MGRENIHLNSSASNTFVDGSLLSSSNSHPPSQVSEFVKSQSGKYVISKILVANNGMAAVKCIRSIRRWAYEQFGDEKAIQFVAMATPEDLDVNAGKLVQVRYWLPPEYIRMADQYIQVPGGTSNNNYSNVDLIVDIAERMAVHAVWVGWGFASENPTLSEKLSQLHSKPIFIGPPPSAMRALGDKIASTIVAQSANVPCISWSGDGLTANAIDVNGNRYVPGDIYKRATANDIDIGLQHALRIGFPVMIKASEGGGGKGIRLVSRECDFNNSFIQVTREVPGSPIFIMKVAQNSRHLEVQLLADSYGNAIAIYGRDCSVQRRHQKILEEAPITIASLETIQSMEAAAVRLAKLVGYVSAGTVEYLYSPETEEYFFMELNPRLQVEHPTTEMVSGVNIPAAQLQIAMGISLNCIKDIRLMYGLSPVNNSEIDFDFSLTQSLQIQRKPSPKGHVIAARITAENPDAGFKPNSGMVTELNFRSNSNVWGYFSLNSSGGVHQYADSQFGHIFSYGETREASRKNLIMALKELIIRGDFRTTVEYLVTLLENNVFIENTFTTQWLDKLISQKLETEKPDMSLTALCGAIFKSYTLFENNTIEYKKALERGQIPNKSLLNPSFSLDFIYNHTQFKAKTYRTGPESISVSINGTANEASVKRMADQGLLLSIGGQTHYVYGKDDCTNLMLIIDGRTCMFEKENDPTKLRSPSPGKLVRYLVEDGCCLKAGDAFAEIEVMKMYMPLLASEAGKISFLKSSGSILKTGDIVGILKLDDPTKVKQVSVFDGKFPFMGLPQGTGDKAHQKFKSLMLKITNILQGYDSSEDSGFLVKSLLELLGNHELPYYELLDVLSSLSGRIPISLEEVLHLMLNFVHDKKFDPIRIQSALIDAVYAAAEEDRVLLTSSLEPVHQVLNRYIGGLLAFSQSTLIGIFEKYLSVEEHFNHNRYEDNIQLLRDQHKSDMEIVVNISRAHQKSVSRSNLILSLLQSIRDLQLVNLQSEDENWRTQMTKIIDRLSHLSSQNTSMVSIFAKKMLVSYQMPTYNERYIETLAVLRNAIGKNDHPLNLPELYYDRVINLITANHAILDVLPSFFYHEEPGIRAISLYTYVLHTSQAYTLSAIKPHICFDKVVLEWDFVLRPTFDMKQGMSPCESRIQPIGGSSISLNEIQVDSKRVRNGLMIAFNSVEELNSSLHEILDNLYRGRFKKKEPMINVLNVSVKSDSSTDLLDDSKCHEIFQQISKQLSNKLREFLFRRITFTLLRDAHFPRYFTFKEDRDFEEEELIRHIEPAMAHQLELHRLEQFNITPIFVANRRLHIYKAVGKKNTSDVRFFLRTLVYPGQLALHNNMTAKGITDFLALEGNKVMEEALDALEIIASSFTNSDCNHFFISIVPTFNVDLVSSDRAVRDLVEKYGARLWKLRITGGEVRFIVRTSSDQSPRPIRFSISNSTGFTVKFEAYQEVVDSNGVNRLFSMTKPHGSLHNQSTTCPYPTKEYIQPKRYKGTICQLKKSFIAHLLGTTYVYDFPDLFKRALEKKWKEYNRKHCGKPPRQIIEMTELVLDSTETLQPIFRESGINTCGMVVWDVLMHTPAYPNGRRIILIANDITFNSGSFGTAEDKLFLKASELARRDGIPRIYISANSGARIGLAEEIASIFKIAWINENDLSKGLKYLYLDENGYKKYVKNRKDSVVKVEKLQDCGEFRYKIEYIVGEMDGIGVENLSGSGLIAGETSKAYNDIFTLTMVTCRSVGIGAYLVRLGQRTIQVRYTPIVLTGANALNKVLGREVYTSNLQLGGTQIMFKNGISHLIAENDLEAVLKTLNWLSYVPMSISSPIPILSITDSVDRVIDVKLSKGLYDPRTILEGFTDAENIFHSGFFDAGSFTETLAGWANGVVVGRARLGGIPMGVIAVDNRATETVIYADPANEKSVEQTVIEAGSIWFPNSSFKTAQAIKDFNNGERLPLIIFANWRGFSGGQSDMYKEILKFGAYIVDSLVDFKQPVFVYLIGELRGGAWVVLDSQINPTMMEMYAEEDSRGGILEAEGIVEIKFKRPQMLATMERLDESYRILKKELSNPLTTVEKKEELKILFEKREKELLPLYHQAAVEFADLHDKPGRMRAKGVIKDILRWETSRTFFYWRVLRRTKEEELIQRIQNIDKLIQRKDVELMLERWFFEDTQTNSEIRQALYHSQDAAVSTWLIDSKKEMEIRLERLKFQCTKNAIELLINSDTKAALDGLISAMKSMDPELKQKFITKLTDS